ncbi:MAG: LLM class flavin-dependent oxidoreductase, partial [Tepidiformaceae bacterium]
SQPGGMISLPRTWEMYEDAAGKAGNVPDRNSWRLVIPFHLSDTREQAIADVGQGSVQFNTEYFENTLGRPADPNVPGDVQSQVDRGGAIVGTPDDAIAAVERMIEISGGFGTLLGLAHEWTTWEKTKHSYELWARYVAPHFQGQLERVRADQAFVADNRASIFGPNLAAIGKAFIDAGVEFPVAGMERMQRGNT